MHFCLGANLARAELGEALAYLAPRMIALELDGEREFDSINGIYACVRCRCASRLGRRGTARPSRTLALRRLAPPEG